TEDFTESLPENVLATGRDIAAAMQGTPATLVRRTQDGRAVVMSAAHPIWSGDEVVGAVVVEETTNPIVSLKTAALERVLLLTLAPEGSEARRYIERAEEGLSRLNRILERMMEASRLEQSLSSAERERYDLVGVVRGCVEGYRVAYPRIAFAVELPRQSLQVEGSPDLAAQLLDKLVENAVDFCRGAEPVRIELTEAGGAAVLSVVNKGRPLPAEFRARLFESMISVREGPQTAAPHLGIGLYVARLIAEYHGGSTDAANLAAGDGVAVTVRIPLAWK